MEKVLERARSSGTYCSVDITDVGAGPARLYILNGGMRPSRAQLGEFAYDLQRWVIEMYDNDGWRMVTVADINSRLYHPGNAKAIAGVSYHGLLFWTSADQGTTECEFATVQKLLQAFRQKCSPTRLHVCEESSLTYEQRHLKSSSGSVDSSVGCPVEPPQFREAIKRTSPSTPKDLTKAMKRKNKIEIDCRGRASEAVAFLVDGNHFVSSEVGGTIRRWRAEDGKEVGTPMIVSDIVVDIAVSRDGKWVVSGTLGDGVTLWNAESHEKLPLKLQTDHVGMVFATDVSPDGTTIATGSGDLTACIWSLSTGERVLGPLEHGHIVVGVKFSPDGRFVATATGDGSNSVRVYDCQDGSLVDDFSITISDLASNQSLAWTRGSEQLFALSHDGNIHCLEISTGTTLSQWPIHCPRAPASIALASNGTFIAVAADTKVSFWDATTYERVGSVIEHADPITSMALSVNYDIVMTTGSMISLSRLYDILPSSYIDGMSRDGAASPMKVDRADPEEIIEDKDSKIARLEQDILRVKEENARIKDVVESLRSDRDLSDKSIATLESTVQNLLTELDKSRRTTDLAIESLRRSSDKRIARLEAILEERGSHL